MSFYFQVWVSSADIDSNDIAEAAELSSYEVGEILVHF